MQFAMPINSIAKHDWELGASHAAHPKSMAPIRNATSIALLTPLFSAVTQSAKRCREVAYSRNSLKPDRPNIPKIPRDRPPSPPRFAKPLLCAGTSGPPPVVPRYVRRALYVNRTENPMYIRLQLNISIRQWREIPPMRGELCCCFGECHFQSTAKAAIAALRDTRSATRCALTTR